MKILIVDDNVASAQTLGWMLDLFGHQALQAQSGEEALRVAAKEIPDVVLMDIGMPGMNGFEACKQMREMPALEKTVFIAQTGWGGDQHKKLSQEAGFSHYLVKPIEIETLQKLLEGLQKSHAA